MNELASVLKNFVEVASAIVPEKLNVFGTFLFRFLERCLQFLAIALFPAAVIVLPVVGFLCVAILFCCRWSWWLAVLYLTWFWYDFRTPQNGSRLWMYWRKRSAFKYMADYFPIKLIKTAELDPERKYIFGCHPHGIMSFSTVLNFATEATHFSDKFPGITTYPCTLAANFCFPIRREDLELCGIIEVSKNSIEHVLTRPTKGDAVVIVVGGAEEALAWLVPVYSFGENEVYHQINNPEGSRLRNFQVIVFAFALAARMNFELQERFKTIFRFSPPIFFGRWTTGFFMPLRRPITTVGTPIPVKKCDEPSRDAINALHARYIQELTTLFDTYKCQFGFKPEDQLNIR
ncbi:unnamed protein product [Soboliphyme baturini]|uniref:Acyltransferase n=1 Tax=Soboliphyme baturini TaxID=241478 RepID=A0A183IBT2_9BILA|nr:unnamed protein product [Soboliphyme baturini]